MSSGTAAPVDSTRASSDDSSGVVANEEALTAVATVSDLLRDAVLFLDNLPLREEGTEESRRHLQAMAQVPAALALAFGDAAASSGHAGFIERVLALLPHIYDRPTRARTLAAVAVAAARSPHRAALDERLCDLLDAAERLPCDWDVEAKAMALAVVGTAWLTAVAADSRGSLLPAQRAAVLRLAARACELGARSDGPRTLCRIAASLWQLLPTAPLIDALLAYCNRRIVRLVLPELTPAQRTRLIASLRARTARCPTPTREAAPSLAALTTHVIGWHRQHVFLPWMEERSALDSRLSAVFRPDARAADAPTPPRAREEAERLARDLCQGRLSVGAFACEPEADTPTGIPASIPALTPLELDILRPVIASVAGSPTPLTSIRDALDELSEWRARITEQHRLAYDAAMDELAQCAAYPEPIPAPLARCTDWIGRADAEHGRGGGADGEIEAEAEADRVVESLRAKAETIARSAGTLGASYESCLAGLLAARLAPRCAAAAAAIGEYAAAPARLLLAHFLLELTGERCDPESLAAHAAALGGESSHAPDRAPRLAAACTATLLTHGKPLPPAVAVRLFASLGPDAIAHLCRWLFSVPAMAQRVLARVATPVRLVYARDGLCLSTFADFLAALARAPAAAAATCVSGTGTGAGTGAGFGAGFGAGPGAGLGTGVGAGVGGVGASVAAATITSLETEALGALPPLTELSRLGRTLLAPQLERDSVLALKLRRVDEPVSVLAHEGEQLRRLRGTPCASFIPEPLGIAALGALPDALVTSAQRQGLRLADDGACLAYRVDREHTAVWTYVNAARPRQRREGLRRAATDLFTWLRRGEAHTALTTKNHHAGSDGDRRYEWLFDVCTLPLRRRGMGRFDRVDIACEYPNVRATGIADLAELTTIDAMLQELAARRDEDATLPDPLPNLHWHPEPVARQLLIARFIGDYLLDLSILLADAYRRRGLRRSQSSFTMVVPALAEELLRLWTHCFAVYTDAAAHAARAWLLAVIDFERMARQIAHFIEPDNYIDELQALLDANDGKEAAATLAARWREELFGPEIDLGIDLSRNRKQWVSRARAKPGGAYGLCSDGVHHDLGCYNGTWPLLELERALYLATGMMLAQRQPI